MSTNLGSWTSIRRDTDRRASEVGGASKAGGSSLGDGDLGGGVVANLLDELALLADDAPAEAIV